MATKAREMPSLSRTGFPRSDSWLDQAVRDLGGEDYDEVVAKLDGLTLEMSKRAKEIRSDLGLNSHGKAERLAELGKQWHERIAATAKKGRARVEAVAERIREEVGSGAVELGDAIDFHDAPARQLAAALEIDRIRRNLATMDRATRARFLEAAAAEASGAALLAVEGLTAHERTTLGISSEKLAELRNGYRIARHPEKSAMLDAAESVGRQFDSLVQLAGNAATEVTGAPDPAKGIKPVD